MPLNLAEVTNRRERFLVKIYEMAEGVANVQVETMKVAEELRVDYDTEASNDGRYWRGREAVDWNSFSWIWLTSKGVSIAEEIYAEKIQASELKCPRCSQSVRATAKFCEHCGNPLDKFHATTIVEAEGTAETQIKEASLIGKVLSAKYEILSQLGGGGGGIVYRARRLPIGDDVAVKVLLDRHLADASYRERFLREAKAAAKIRHRNVVQIYDFSEGDGNEAPAFLVMELVEGESLDTLLKREGYLEPTRAVTLLREMCAGIGAAHRVDVFHRDLKPSNMIILPASSESTTESVKIIDFGIARLENVPVGDVVTEIGTVLGTPVYMSPEQCRGEPCDARSDVYSLGVILYEMIAGKPPFTGTNNADIISMHLRTTPPRMPQRSGVTQELEAVLMRALAKEPNERQTDASALSQELKNALHSEAPAPVTREPAPTFRIPRSEMETDLLLEESDDLVFVTSCKRAMKVGHLKHISVIALVEELEEVMTKDEVLDSLEILTQYGYIEPSQTVGCGLRMCDFEITIFGFEQYALHHVDDYEAKRQATVVDIVRGNKSVFKKPELITGHILDALTLDGLIKISKFIGGTIKVTHVSAQLKRKHKD